MADKFEDEYNELFKNISLSLTLIRLLNENPELMESPSNKDISSVLEVVTEKLVRTQDILDKLELKL